ncbi:MAG: NYN domain-containing protein [Planctomycetota bacterium]|nr:NYN domain-containing protein [Planctomycetota bacterium]
MVIWIIDGNNLIHSDPRLRQRMVESGLESARKLLDHDLARIRSADEQFHIVYDGGGSTREQGGVFTSIAQKGHSADDRVLALARNKSGQGKLIVVTDDRSDIGARLGGVGIEWMTCSEFRSNVMKLGTGRKASANDDSCDKPPLPRSKNQVDHWLKEFGVTGEEE